MPPIPLEESNFKLDTSGVAGYFGGEEAISAMSTVNIYKGRVRRWMGWYNSPGSYVMARNFGQLAASRFWDGLFPGPDIEPTDLFGLEGDIGPQFVGSASGSYIRDTGQIGYLFMKLCQGIPTTTEEEETESQLEKSQTSKDLNVEELKTEGTAGKPTEQAKATAKRSPVAVTIVDIVDRNSEQHQKEATLPQDWTAWMALFPVLFSLGACITCGIFDDTYCAVMIALGMVANGVACLAFGWAKFEFHRPKPAPNCPKGDGILFSLSGPDVVIVRGEEEAVASITRGKFVLQFPGEPEYQQIGLASMVLTVQTLAQLLLIPQGTLFGQILFLATLFASWIYNCVLSSRDKYKIQQQILTNNVVKVDGRKQQLKSRTAMVAFILLTLQPDDPKIILEKLLPNHTKTWVKWKDVVCQKVREEAEAASQPGMNNHHFSCGSSDSDYAGLDEQEAKLLRTFYNDANHAYDIYRKVRHPAS